MFASKSQKISAALSVALGLYAIGGFYLLPSIVTAKLPVLVAKQTDYSAQLKNLSFNPFSFELSIDELTLNNRESKTLLAFENLTIDLAVWGSLFQQSLAFDRIALAKPIANIEHYQNGRFNFSDLVGSNKPTEQTAASAPLKLTVHQLTIEEGHLSWQETLANGAQSETLLPVNLSLSDFNSQSANNSHFDLSFNPTSGGHVHWYGDFSLMPMASSGQLNLDDIALNKIWQLFLQELIPITFSDGRLSLETDYQAKDNQGTFSFSSDNGNIEIKQLCLNQSENKRELLTIPELKINSIRFNSDQQQVNINSVNSNNGTLKAWLDTDGQINYQQLFKSEPPVNPPAAPTTPEKPWQIQLEQLTLNNYRLLLSEQEPNRPIADLSKLNLNIDKLSNQAGQSFPLQLSTLLNQSATIVINGNVSTSPFKASLNTDIKELKLHSFQSYLDRYINLELVDGELNSHGNFEINSGETFQLNFNGDANLANLITRDKIKNKDLLKWSDLQLQKINFDLGKQKLNLDKVIFDQPYLRLTIKKDHKTNISELVIPQTQNTDNTESAPMLVNIGQIELKQGHSDFADYSLLLPFVTEIKALNGSIDSISSDQKKPAKLALQGKVFDLALVDIKGDYQLNNGDSDITLSFTHMPLPLITPYMAEFSGYTIEKGQMALDLKYTIKKGELQAQNKIYIDQLALGDHVVNPHASSLPIHLAIALLKDSSGKINLDFPISGSLNDPHFNFESFIANALSNMITKVAASPFTALGSLLEQDRDYSSVKFLPGSSELNAEEISKLEQLGKALNTKTDLNIEIKGMAFQDQDWSAIRFDSILEILRKMKSGELRDQGQKIRSEYIELSESEYKRLMVKFFKEVFPLEPVEVSLFGTPRLKSQPDADFYILARQKLESAMPPEPQRLNDLVVTRANSIAKYLIEKCQVNRDSIYILATELNSNQNSEIMSILSLNASP
ncbi:MAG: DUF748 domain-containing protein [Methylomonas sp.]